ncbi:MAG: hypothetical protein R3F43_08495 [bacterium]
MAWETVSGADQLIVWDTVGTNHHLITTPFPGYRYLSHPSWAPDGSEIFIGYHDDPQEKAIGAVAFPSATTRTLYATPPGGFWSPDAPVYGGVDPTGRAHVLVYATGACVENALFRIPVEGGALDRVWADGFPAPAPSSPPPPGTAGASSSPARTTWWAPRASTTTSGGGRRPRGRDHPPHQRRRAPDRRLRHRRRRRVGRRDPRARRPPRHHPAAQRRAAGPRHRRPRQRLRRLPPELVEGRSQRARPRPQRPRHFLPRHRHVAAAGGPLRPPHPAPATATSVCGGPVQIDVDPPTVSGGGSHTVTYTATDRLGHQASCTTVVSWQCISSN